MVAILMATYNGAAYIRQQIESIISQDYTDWNLYVRDDGSTDGTVDIVRALMDTDPRISLVHDDSPHRGCAEGFLWLLHHTEADFFMFCDQDDVWLPGKVRLSVEAAEKVPADIPVLVSTDLRVVDGDLNTVHESMWKANLIDSMVDNPANLAISPMFTGCTILLNRAARDIIPEHIGRIPVLHDQFAAFMVARHHGRIIALHTPTILYRQHSANVLGFKDTNPNRLRKLLNMKKFCAKNIRNYRLASLYLGLSLPQYLKVKIPSLLPRRFRSRSHTS